MQNQELEQLRYPIGRFKLPDNITEAHINKWIETLEQFPIRLEAMENT